jgi:UPF0755 protein
VSDDLGLFSDYAEDPPLLTRRQRRLERERARRRRRHRTLTALAGLCVLALVAGGVLYGARQLLRIGSYADYSGQGSGQVVVEVKAGDTTSDIAETLERQGVVASVKAFTKAAATNPAVAAVQPGFYLMRGRMSGQAAVALIVSPAAKVGQIEIRGGMRLDDENGPNAQPGILTKLAQASCAQPGGGGPCPTPDQMRAAAAQIDLAASGVPGWATGPASATQPPEHRLEGLIMPGVYDVKPGQSPQDILRSVLKQSADEMQAAGLPQAADGTGFTPYQLLTLASLVQSEGIEQDFGKIVRVIDNRLQQKIPLQLDSTINYPLDKPVLLTTDADRGRPGPYNTYLNEGLPPAPISSVSSEAITAAAKPPAGTWLYFVKCETSGASCFEDTQAQHNADVRMAQQRGVF